jgi:chemotaxis protein MotB
MADDKPIIVVKKKGGHGGHHGGAWKIAYADFVTAMMAFFMVMWLVNSASSPTKESISSYFRKPGIFNEGSGTPLLIGGAGILEDAFAPPKFKQKVDPKQMKNLDPQPNISGESKKNLDKIYQTDGKEEPVKAKGPDEVLGLNSELRETREIQNEKDIDRTSKIKKLAEDAKQQLKALLEKTPELSAVLGQLDFKVETDGLKIEIMDTDKVSMFDSGSARIKKEAEDAFRKVSAILQKFPNQLDVSGHTDAKPFPSRTGGYTNWELSSDRANAARRLLENQGFPTTQIGSVIGRAATEPKTSDDPLASRNRRITLKMKFDVTQELEVNPAQDPTKALEDLLGPLPGSTRAPEPTPTPTPTPTPEPELGEDTPTPRPTPAPPKDRIRLPDGPPIIKNPDYMPEDKIFNDNPVVGPAEMFSGR